MNFSDALRTRIWELVKDEKSLTSLCLNSNITPSTVFDFINGKSNYPNMLTIKRLCLGAGITLKDFFDRDYFEQDDLI